MRPRPLTRIERYPLVFLLGMGPLLGCRSTPFPEGRHPDVRILESVPAEKPSWLDRIPVPREGRSFFVGNSNYASSETEAKDLALDAALKKAAIFVGIQLDGEVQDVRKMDHDASTVADPAIEVTEHWVGKTSAYFSRFQPEEWFVQHLERSWGRRGKERSFSASVLVSIPTEVVEAAIEEAEQLRRQPRDYPSASLDSPREASPEREVGRRLRLAEERRPRLVVPRAIDTSPPSTPATQRVAQSE
jgi:hypothetical protein